MERIVSLEKNTPEMETKPRQVLDDLTVIIPTVGRNILQRCLQAIADGAILPACIIVIDQGDNLLVADWLNHLKTLGLESLHLRSTEKGPASARNLGLERVQTPFVAAIDDDCIAEKDWLKMMEMQLHQNPGFIITGRVEPAGDGIAPTVVTSDIPRLYRRPSVRIPSPLTSGNMGVALQTARTIGLFDTGLITAEDNDWAYRALRASVPILYAPDVIVYHYHWRNKTELATTYRSYALGQGAFYGKHLRKGDWSMVLGIAISMFRGLRDLFYGVIKNNYTQRLNGITRVIWLLPGLVDGLRGLRSS